MKPKRRDLITRKISLKCILKKIMKLNILQNVSKCITEDQSDLAVESRCISWNKIEDFQFYHQRQVFLAIYQT